MTSPSSPTVPARRRVLFVDDDPQFLELNERVMSTLAQGAWEVLTAESAGRALSLLQEHNVQLVVIDVQMPVVDGLQFLTLLNRRYPNLPKVVLTGFATEAYRVACLSNGAELFLEKPKTPDGQKALFSMLDQLMHFQPDEGFRGVLRRAGLPDVIQMECLSGNSSILDIAGAQGRGRIYIHEGVIIHAEASKLIGQEAFNFILALRGGEFRIEPFTQPPHRTIQGSWEFLLMEAARNRDEVGSGTEPPIPLTPPKPPSQFDPELPPPEPRSANTTVTQITESTGQPAPAPLTDDRRTIDEVFICSPDGKVLHEWHVRNPDLWVNFFEFLSQRARRLGLSLPLGSFRRLEAAAGNSRLLALIRDDGAVLVRCREESQPSA